jgi:hypothetical protein
VPSVLDSAAEVLATSPDGGDAFADVSVVQPAPSALAQSISSILTASPVRSRGTSPIRSRSPSPLRRLSAAPSSLEQSLLAGSPPISRPPIDTQTTVTQVPKLDGATLDSAASSPTTSTLPTATPANTFASQQRIPSGPIPRGSPPLSPGSESLRAPPSPSRAAKRLSFISYADLLGNTPASTVPLASLTSSADAAAPPPHLPSVIGLADSRAVDSAASSVHGLSLGGVASGGHGHGFGERGHAARSQRESMLLVAGEEVGGEWEREGLGMGLEERIEAVLGTPALAGKA